MHKDWRRTFDSCLKKNTPVVHRLITIFFWAWWSFRTSRSLDLKIHVCWYWENKAHLHLDSLFRNSRPELFLKTAEKLLQIDRRNWSKLHILPVSLLELGHVLIFFLERFQYTFWSIWLIYSITLQKDLSLQNYYRKNFFLKLRFF